MTPLDLLRFWMHDSFASTSSATVSSAGSIDFTADFTATLSGNGEKKFLRVH